jgi:NADPH2 dehydrogenase
MNTLFSTFTIKNQTIKNRVVFPPVVNFGWADEAGFINEKHYKHYRERAEGGVGLIIVEATCVKTDGKIFSYQPGIWSDKHIEAFKPITESCHKNGALVLLQIHHAGLLARKTESGKAGGPSIDPAKENSFALSVDEIKAIEQAFINGAIRAKDAGFDGVELHGAHGYLLNQFANSAINLRNDDYGNSLPGRLKLASDIIKGIRLTCGENFIIGYRLGANSPTLPDGIEVAKHLEQNGVDILHISHGGEKGIKPDVPSDFPNNWIVYCGTEVKKHVKTPIIVVNEIRTPQRASWLIENGISDFVAIGRDLLTDSQWANKAQSNQEINHCINCQPRCKRFGRPESCPVLK